MSPLKKKLFNNRYLNLGDTFYVKTKPTCVSNPSLIKFNSELAEFLGLSDMGVNAYEEDVAIFSGNSIPEGAEPLAMAYSGHQFGSFNPQLGDGRAILLGEITAPNGESFGLQLKGSGRTAFSRNGDGRSALGPVLREYILSEAMYKLGVPTTRALAAVTTGEQVARERLIPGGIVTRVATSFVRVGTFEYFASRGDVESIKKLADYVIERNYPKVLSSDNKYKAFLQAVVNAQASLIAQWMSLGFIHGVMNTDNMSVAGETIDYGPCAFMDEFSNNKVFSSIDRDGRYAYNNQPSIALWDLTRLAESLLPLLAESANEAVEIAQNILKTFVIGYQGNWLASMQNKMGLVSTDDESKQASDKALIEELFAIMEKNNSDFTLTFYHLSRLSVSSFEKDGDIKKLFNESSQFDTWLAKWRKRLSDDKQSNVIRQGRMQAVNPVYIPRNHQIESAIRAAEDNDDFSVFHDLYEVLQNPYLEQKGQGKYMLPPQPIEVVTKTFCGT